MHHPTAFVTPVVEHWLEREIAQWVHPMKDRSDDQLHHEQMLLPQSYIIIARRSPKFTEYEPSSLCGSTTTLLPPRIPPRPPGIKQN